MRKTIHISLTTKSIPVRFDVVQYATYPEIEFICDDFIPSGSARIYVKKPSGAKVYNDCTIEGNSIIYKVTNQTFAELGINECQLEVMMSDGTAVSFKMFAHSSENIIDSEAVESTDEFTALEEALSTVGQYDSRIAQNESNISDLQSDVADNTSAIATNTANISTNTTNIATNTADIAQNTADIAQNTADIAQNTTDIATNTANIEALTEQTAPYQDGDTLELTDVVCAGGVTGSGKKLFASIPLCRTPMECTISLTAVVARGVNGYIEGSTIDLTDKTVTCQVRSQSILLLIDSTTAFTNATNNTPATVSLTGVITFATTRGGAKTTIETIEKGASKQ